MISFNRSVSLVVLFLLATALIALNIDPFTSAGVFLSLCFLPGLCLFCIGNRNRASFEDIVLSFPFSVGISSLLVVSLLLLGVRINYIPFLIHIMIGLCVAISVFSDRKNNVTIDISITKQEMFFFVFALMITLVLSIPFFTGVNRIGIAGHAFHHSLMVSQIINGIFPPENPGLGGTIIGYYWGFHALIAGLTIGAGYQQLQVVFILNLVSLYFIFCILYCFAKAFDLSEGYRYLLPVVFLGLMRTDAGILFLMKLVTGSLSAFNEITASPIEPIDVLLNWISGIPWLDTRQFILRKLYNISGMLLSMNLCFAYLLIILRMAKNNFMISKIYGTAIAFIIFASLFTYPPLAIFLLLHVPLWTVYTFYSIQGEIREKFRAVLRIGLPFIAAVLIVAPYLLFVMASRDVSSGGQGGLFSFAFYDQSLKNMAVFYIPMPLIIYGVWISYKRWSFSREFSFLLIGTMLCLVLTVFTKWPFDNSYKYNYILALFFSIYFVAALTYLSQFVRDYWVKGLFWSVIIIFLLLTPAIVELSHIASAFSSDYQYVFSGKHIAFGQDEHKNEAYTWIREHTPVQAMLMLSYIETNWPCCGFNNNYEPAAIAERTLYAITDADYTSSNPEYARRIEFREKLFEDPEDAAVIDFFASLKKPVYLLIEEDLPRDTYFVEERFDRFPENPGKPFVLQYKNDRQRVYLVDITD